MEKLSNNRESYIDGIKLCLQIIDGMIDDCKEFGQDYGQLEQASKNIIRNM